MLRCGRQLQLCSVKNKTQLSHTVYHSLQQLFLSGGFFCFNRLAIALRPVYPCAAECTWLHITGCTELSMESMMVFCFVLFDSSFSLKAAISKQTWQLHRCKEANWLIFFQCSGLRIMNYIQYVRLLMSFQVSPMLWDWETTAGITLMIHTPECRYEVKPPTSSFILNLICACVHLKVLTGI